MGGGAANQDRCTAGRSSEDEGRILKWDPNAALTRWPVGNDTEGVDRQAALEEGAYGRQPEVIAMRTAHPLGTDRREASVCREHRYQSSRDGASVYVFHARARVPDRAQSGKG
jgi:hypothetical protein